MSSAWIDLSRPKPDWDKGTVVLTGDGTAYRVGVIEQRTIAGALGGLVFLAAGAPWFYTMFGRDSCANATAGSMNTSVISVASEVMQRSC